MFPKRNIRNLKHFNSQPHKEADRSQGFLSESYIISTHSLTRRLTITDTGVAVTTTISTHSLTRRLTSNVSPGRTSSRYFNSQPHKEADKTLTLRFPLSVISTHSLTRRLTPRSLSLNISSLYFNSQPHKEADTYEIRMKYSVHISTHSLTRRLTKKMTLATISYSFQLTASQGG